MTTESTFYYAMFKETTGTNKNNWKQMKNRIDIAIRDAMVSQKKMNLLKIFCLPKMLCPPLLITALPTLAVNSQYTPDLPPPQQDHCDW